MHRLFTLLVNGYPLAWPLDIDACLSLAHTIIGAQSLQCAAQAVGLLDGVVRPSHVGHRPGLRCVPRGRAPGR